VRLSEFDYELPEELIAQEPLQDRAASRMLVVDRAKGTWEDRGFREFPSFVGAGDCLVLNDTRVFPSRLYGRRENGTGRVEIFLTRATSADGLTWEALVRPGKKMRSGERIVIADDLTAEILGRGEFGERTVRLHPQGDLDTTLDRVGHVPLPPYIRRPDTSEDRERYQTVFAQARGSVAAPTAGLHFDEPLLAALGAAAVDEIQRPFEPCGLNAWTDAALMQSAGIPTVLIGSAGGNYHAPDEWASIPELTQLARIVEGTARTFCGIDE
jgi:S-adenosylmethionine:tRNA ribosyltransferase-isomerase